MEALRQFELHLMHSLHDALRHPLLDAIFKFFAYLDTYYFYLLLILVVWLGYHWKLGIKLFYLLMFNAILNQSLKQIFALPRPDVSDPSVALMKIGGYGFPSGAAQSSVILAAFLIYYSKNRKIAWPIGIIYCALVSFSRLYLGAHYFSDVIVGIFIGLIFWAFYILTINSLEKVFENIRPGQLLLVLTILAIAVFYSTTFFLIDLYSLAALGVAFGVYFSHIYKSFLPKVKTFKEFCFRAAYGAITTFALFYSILHGLRKLQEDVTNILWNLTAIFFGIWLSFLSSYIYKQFRKKYLIFK